MIKRLLLTLLFIPTLCFAKLGDSKTYITEQLGEPIKVYTITARTELDRYLFPDGETVLVVTFLNGLSVVETYFSNTNREATNESLVEMCRKYSEKWVPLETDLPDNRCIATVDGKIRVCYGPMVGTKILHALTIMSMDCTDALQDMSSSGLRL